MTEQNVSRRHINKSVIVISIVLLLIMLIRILLHYRELGFFEFILFEVFPKWLLFIFPLAFLASRIVKKQSLKITVFDFLLTIIGFYMLYYVLTPAKLDRIDWNINYEKRQKIVSLAKQNKLNNVRGYLYAIPDSLALSPSCKSTIISIEKQKDALVTITFYTDGGLVDHYSGFVYTNDITDIENFDERVKKGGNDTKLENNWYFIHE